MWKNEENWCFVHIQWKNVRKFVDGHKISRKANDFPAK